MKDEVNFKKYEKHYNEKKFSKKIIKYAQSAGIKVIYMALLLFYVIQKPELPKHIKAIIIGGLGYFILPLDLISDLIPGIGYTDDASVLIGALVMAATYIDDDVKLKARKKINELFKNIDEKNFTEVENSIVKKS